MNKVIKFAGFLLPIAFIVCLSACGGVLYPGTVGEERVADDNYISSIKPNETTKNDIRKMFGEPRSVVRSSNGDTMWAYVY